jgi:hypothetical protein
MQSAREANWKGKLRGQGQYELIREGEEVEREVEEAMR